MTLTKMCWSLLLLPATAALGAQTTVGPFTFNNSTPQIRPGLTFQDMPEYSPTPGPLPDTSGSQDSTGVRMYTAADGRVYDHPVVLGRYAIQCIADWHTTGNRAYLERAVLHANRLISIKSVSGNAWYFPYRFDFDLSDAGTDIIRAPWYSGMAQGLALSVFSRLYEATGDGAWLSNAQQVFNSFLIAPSSAALWSVRSDPNGYYWIEEYAEDPSATGGDYVLNGHSYGLYGLYDYYRETGNQDAFKLWQGAVTTAKWAAQQYRVEGYVSRYCLKHGFQSKDYQLIHLALLLNLWDLTGDTGFAQLADLYYRDSPANSFSGTAAISGGVTGFRFEIWGHETASNPQLLTETGSTIGTRTVVRGQKGIWLQMNTGALAGWWIEKNPVTAYMRGVIQPITYIPPRNVMLVPGFSLPFRKFSAQGNVVANNDRYFPAERHYQFDQRATINGSEWLHLVNAGEFSDYWTPANSDVVVDK